MKRLSIIISALLLILLKGNAQSEPKIELRSVFVASAWNLDWPKKEHRNDSTAQKAELIRMLNFYKAINLNAVFLQVRPECDALYNSAYEPWSRYLSTNQGDNPGYDPLQFAIIEAHKRGIELHAWLNPYRINASESDDGDYYHSTHIYYEHPEWAIEYSTGNKILNPGRPEVMSYIGSIVRDIVSNYSVDGIHFDDYFYFYSNDGTPSSLDATEYASYGGSMSLSDWRRDNINRMIDTVYKVIQEENPSVRFGISPFGSYKNGVPPGISTLDAYSQIYCDPLAWLESGSVDYIAPQIYWPTGGEQDFETLANWWSDQVFTYGKHFFVSHGIFKMPAVPNLKSTQPWNELHEYKAYFDLSPNTSSEISTRNYSNLEQYSTSDPVSEWTLSEVGLQIDIVRLNKDKNSLGNVFYRANFLESINGLADYLANNKYTHPTLIPEMTWKSSPAPISPTNLVEEKVDTIVYLKWDYTNNNANDRFAIYSSESIKEADEIISDPANLKIVCFENQISLADLELSDSTTIVVTAVSAFGKESLPVSHSVNYLLPEIITQLPADTDTIRDSDELSWDCNDAGALFQIQISENQSYSNPIVNSTWINTNQLNLEEHELEGESTYHWRARAKTDVIGAYSVSRSFITGFPMGIETTYPVNLSLNVSTSPKIYWNTSTTIDSVQVQIAKTSSFNTTIADELFDAKLENGVISTELEKNTNYYLRIAAKNKFGTSPFSSFITFKTTAGEIPVISAIISPNDATTVASFDEIEWETTTTIGTIEYFIEVATNEEFATIISNSNWISETKIAVSDLNLEGNMTYYWRIKAKSEFGESEFYPGGSFTTGYPTKPDITSPIQLSENNDVNPLISWNADENTESVYVEVSESSDFEQVDNSETFDISNTNARLTNSLQGYTWYFIRVAAVNSFGNSIFSTNKYFKTEAASPINEIQAQHEFSVYPNPYIENQTKIGLNIKQTQSLKIDLVSSVGKTIATIYENNFIVPGYYKIDLNIDYNIAPGIYFIRVYGFNTVSYAPLIVAGE